MATKKPWHPKFLEYMSMIAHHPNYAGLPITRKPDGSLTWIAVADSEIGKKRKEWAEKKALDMGYTLGAGVYAEVMRAIHPTKKHVCQICGSEMSIEYVYPTKNFRKAIEKKFNMEFSVGETISETWDKLLANGNDERSIISFMSEKFSIPMEISDSKNDILSACEFECRKKRGGLLSPGVMSNFPDRFDGFHSYNLCCRASHDKGRFRENLRSYGKDRRAYEYWSDGNIHAADLFMNGEFFEGSSADHIGPISLGFVHDPRYLRRMTGRDNSIKRDRLEVRDVEEIYSVEISTGVYPMTWYSSLIWEQIKRDFEVFPELVSTVYRDLLKQNVANYMYILKFILENAPLYGKNFLSNKFIESKYEYFTLTYEFDDLGNITSEEPRHITERSKYEIDRFRRIAFESVMDYYNKSESESRRNLSGDLTMSELNMLLTVCQEIEKGTHSFETAFNNLKELMVTIQNRLLKINQQGHFEYPCST